MSTLDSTQQAARDQFDRQSAKYGSGHILQNIEDLKRALLYVNLYRGGRALDVATGGGHTGLYLAEQGMNVVLADLSFSMLDKVKSYAAERKLDVNLCCHPAEKFPYSDATFDLLTCRFAAHHFTCPATFAMESARVLKKGGRAILIDGTVEDNQPVAEEWIHKVEKFRDPSHGRFVTPDKWSWLFREAGFRVLNREIVLMKQPDLQWYFDAAATSPENRDKVYDLLAHAPDEARQLFKLTTEKGTTVWWWQIVVIVVEKVR